MNQSSSYNIIFLIISIFNPKWTSLFAASGLPIWLCFPPSQQGKNQFTLSANYLSCVKFLHRTAFLQVLIKVILYKQHGDLFLLKALLRKNILFGKFFSAASCKKKSVIRPWLSCQYEEHILVDLPYFVSVVYCAKGTTTYQRP